MRTRSELQSKWDFILEEMLALNTAMIQIDELDSESLQIINEKMGALTVLVGTLTGQTGLLEYQEGKTTDLLKIAPKEESNAL